MCPSPDSTIIHFLCHCFIYSFLSVFFFGEYFFKPIPMVRSFCP